MSRPQYDRELFYPLDGKPRRARFGTVDIESKDGPTQRAGFTRPFMAGFYDGENYKAFFDTDPSGDPMTRHLRDGGCIDRLMRCCLSGKRHGFTYYCHNGGGFDFLHFLPWLMRNAARLGLIFELVPVGNSRLLSIHVKPKGSQKWGGWKFVDSLRTLPMSLDKAGVALEVGGKNSDELVCRDGSKFTLEAHEDDPAWVPYNRRDCVLLFEVLEKAHDIVENEFGGEMGLTAPATAMKTFRRSFLHEPIRRDTATHAFVRLGYFGGRTEGIIPEGRYLAYYDVNSSYPHAMTMPMPVGNAETWGEGEPPREYLETRIGFCRVTVNVPHDIALPPLPVRADGAYFPENSGLDGKLLFPTGKLRGVWEWSELENAVDHGCTILEWHESVWYEAGPLLAEFVEVLYRYRDKGHCFRCNAVIGSDYYCKACGKAGYSPGLDSWAKLLLNSLYGKFGQRPERMTYHHAGDPDLPEGSMPLMSEDPHCPIWVAQTEVDSPFIMPQIAARVTAIGRVTLYKAATRALKAVVRECWSCHSRVTYQGHKTGKGWVLGDRIGGSGTHGDELAAAGGRTIDRQCLVCPCGGAIETRHGRVYYMDTDSVVVDVNLPSSKALGALKDEVPRYSGFLHGRFYASKMYTLSVEPEWLKVAPEVRMAMMKRDGGFLASLGGKGQPVSVEEALDHPKTKGWTSVRSKGLSRDNRTAENLQKLYDGAMTRLEWAARPENRYSDGSLRDMPPEIEHAGTIVDKRLEQFGTLANLIERDADGAPVLAQEDDGYWHVTATPFVRGPQMVEVPRRLHLDGAKRKIQPDGTSSPYHVDMTAERPRWWLDREARRADLRKKREARSKTARVTKPKKAEATA